MSVQPPPSNTSGNYNPTDWTNGNQFVDEAYISENFLSYPSAQGQETLADTIISGTLTAQSPATFSDLATFNNGIDISTTAGVKFSDDTVQTTAFIEANYAQLNTDNTFLAPYVQKFASGITFGDDTTQTTAFIEANYAQLNTDNTFLAPYQNTFAGNASTGNANAPIKLTNGVAGEYATLYLNPSVGEDITLYTNQTTNGGLTVRNPTNSYTINPATINGTNNWANFLNPINSSLGINAGYVNINGTSSSTLNVYAPSSTINYTQISQQNGSSSVIANSYWAGSSGGIYFELKSDSTNYYSPFNITSGLVQCLPTLTCSSAINSPQYNLSTSVGGSGINFKYYASGVASMNILGVDTFAIQNTGNNIMTFNYYEINAYKDINMNNNDINNCNSVNSSGTLNLTGTSVLINGSPIPSTAGFAILNTATVQTFTGQVNFTSPLTSIPKVNTVCNIVQANTTTFAYQYTNYTLTYTYTNYNTLYQPANSFSINNLGVKRFIFGQYYYADFSTSNLYQICNPTIQNTNPSGTITTPSVIVLANYDITPYNDTFDWSFEYTQPITLVCSSGTQTAFIKASRLTSYNGTTPIYNLQITLNALANNVNTFNSGILYNINGFSLCWT